MLLSHCTVKRCEEEKASALGDKTGKAKLFSDWQTATDLNVRRLLSILLLASRLSADLEFRLKSGVALCMHRQNDDVTS